VKRLKKIIREEEPAPAPTFEQPETISEFHAFIKFLSSQIRRAADLLYQVGDDRHKKRAEHLRNHAFQELEIAKRYENDPDRLRSCMLRLQKTLGELKDVANEEESEGH